jgi:hypothetical protein
MKLDRSEYLVIAGAIALILLVIWYFFGKRS